MFRTPNLSKLMKWHHDNISMDGYVKHVVDSKAWAHINSTWLEFAKELDNLRPGLALNGVNQFGNQSSTWSTWPIFILNYNLPPWVTTKKFFLMLALLIPGKKSVKNRNIDVYLAPLLEESQLLWKGVYVWDVTRLEG